MSDDDNKTLWCGNISEQVSEEILYELFLQAGPLEKVRIPRERDGRQKNFAFITYHHEVSVPYALALFRGTALFHRTLTLQCRARMAPLPPPIRCNSLGLDHSFEFQANPHVRQQFEEMSQRNDIDIYNHFDDRQPAQQNDLVMASLQGNWSHRHHPYDRTRERPDRRHNRDNSDNRHEDDHGNAYNKQQRDGGWRDRQNNAHSGRHNNRRNYNRRN